MAVWTVEIITMDGSLPEGEEIDYDNPIQIDYTSFKFTRVLNDAGAAELHLDLDQADLVDPVTGATILELLREKQSIVKFLQDGVYRCSIIPDENDENYVQGDETRPFIITGRGAVPVLLEMGTVLPPTYPGTVDPHGTGYNWEWQNISAIAAWWNLYVEAYWRDAMSSMVQITFTETNDSDAVPWANIFPSLTVEPGSDLFTMWRRFVEIQQADWVTSPGFDQMVCRQTQGVHREATIRFYIGEHQITNKVKRNRRAISNVIYTIDKDNNVTMSQDVTSQNKWGTRELSVETSTAGDEATSGDFGGILLNKLKDEVISMTVKVRSDTPGMIPFVNYDLGDWVWVDSDIAELASAYRVISIGISVNEDAEEDLELVLESAPQPASVAIQRQVQRDTGSDFRFQSELQVSNNGGAAPEPEPEVPVLRIPAFTQSGDVTPALSSRWVNLTGETQEWDTVNISIAEPGTTLTRIWIVRNDTDAVSYQIAANDDYTALAAGAVVNSLAPGEFVHMEVEVAGTNARRLTVQLSKS